MQKRNTSPLVDGEKLSAWIASGGFAVAAAFLYASGDLGSSVAALLVSILILFIYLV